MKTIFTFEYKGREVEAILFPDSGHVCFVYKDNKKEKAIPNFVLMGDWKKETKAGVMLIKKPVWKQLHNHVKAMMWLYLDTSEL